MSDQSVLDRLQSTHPATAAYVADRLFDGETVRLRTAVLVRGTTILGICDEEQVPSGARVLRFPGCTVLPGLVDAHVHYMSWQGPLFLAHGVTTVRDVGNDLAWILDARDAATRKPWPRIVCTGPLVEGPRAVWSFGRSSPDLDACLALCDELINAGVDAVKLYASIPEPWVPALVERVHAAGRKAVMHCLTTPAVAAAEAGIDEFFHLDGLLPSLWPERPKGWLELWGHPDFASTLPAQERAADRLAASRVAATPTLAYWDSRCADVRGAYGSDRPPVPDAVRAWQEDVFPRRSGTDETWVRGRDAAMRFAGMLRERGVPLGAGTDEPLEGMMPGMSLWRELALLADSGLGAEGALCSATSVAAGLLDLPDAGRLRPGSRADLVVVRGDPTVTIPRAPDIRLVVRDGTEHTAEEMRATCAAADSTPEADPIGKAISDRVHAARLAGRNA